MCAQCTEMETGGLAQNNDFEWSSVHHASCQSHPSGGEAVPLTHVTTNSPFSLSTNFC